MLSSASDPVRQIRIGGIEYNVAVVERLEDSDRAILHAIIDTYECTIKVTSGMTKKAELIEIWHETIHAIMKHAGQDGDKEKLTELQVRALSHGIVQVLSDNGHWLAGT